MEKKCNLKSIRALFLDVDGVMSDGKIIYGNGGEELKAFNVKDGMGIAYLLKQKQFIVGVITGRKSDLVARRCKELGMTFHYHGIFKKIDFYEKAKMAYGLKDEEIAYIGDDINDIPVFNRCGFSACPNDAFSYVKEQVSYVSSRKGGEGVVREVIDMILNEQNELDKFVNFYVNLPSVL